MRKYPNIPHQDHLEIPFTLKTYIWDRLSNAYRKEKGKHFEGDDGLEFEGRTYAYHPTKGWRSRNSKFIKPATA